jgi:hypothetical protein
VTKRLKLKRQKLKICFKSLAWFLEKVWAITFESIASNLSMRGHSGVLLE